MDAPRTPEHARALLVSTYDLGRPPFGLASPAAWLEREGWQVRCLDLAVEPFDEAAVADADFIAIHLPMHTATRLAGRILPRIREHNAAAPIAAYGLYAPLNAGWLAGLGVERVIGGEYEQALSDFAREVRARNGTGPAGDREFIRIDSFERLPFLPPARHLLPPLQRYAHLHMPDGSVRLTGATEASRGCRHQCRHCPVTPVYSGLFRIVPRDVVLADIAAQVAAGARHITFGDPDFLNGPGHAVPIVRELARRWPGLSYDVTIKVEHLVRHEAVLATLAATGCAFVTSAFESFDDRVLERLDKGHTRADIARAVNACREAGLPVQPTFVPFTPWTTPDGYRDMLAMLRELDLVESVAPVQLALRLLLPAGSRLLDLAEIRKRLGPFNAEGLVYPWVHEDPEVDRLQSQIQQRITDLQAAEYPRPAIFAAVEELAGSGVIPALEFRRAPVPYLSEPWYC